MPLAPPVAVSRPSPRPLMATRGSTAALPPSVKTASSNAVPRWRRASVRETPSIVCRKVTHAKLESSSASTSGVSAEPPVGSVRSCGAVDRLIPKTLRARTCVRPSTPCSPQVMIPTPSALTATFERSTPVPAFAPGSTSAGIGSSAHAFVRRSRRATTTFPACVNDA